MKEITSKRTKQTQFITDEEWDWLKEHGKAKNFTMKEMVIIKKPVINKESTACNTVFASAGLMCGC